MSFFNDGFQATEQYSKRGRTYVIKAFTKLLTSLERKNFDIKFATLWPLTDSLAMCWERLRLWSSVTPKSSTSRTTDKRLLWKKYTPSDDWFKLKIQHLFSEIGSCQVCDHSTILFKPSWSESEFVQTFEYSCFNFRPKYYRLAASDGHCHNRLLRLKLSALTTNAKRTVGLFMHAVRAYEWQAQG